MKCLTGECKKAVTRFIISKENAIVPTECEIGDLKQLLSYFQFRAPNIDAVQSPMLEPSYHKDTLYKITNGRDDFRFCNQNSETEDELSKLALNGKQLCSWCKRFLCKRMTHKAKRDPSRTETDLECLLRHLRNSIAHGHVFAIPGGNYIRVLLEDVNDKGKTTARIICCQSDLRKWETILENAVKENTHE